jgi:hypothetical protein
VLSPNFADEYPVGFESATRAPLRAQWHVHCVACSGTRRFDEYALATVSSTDRRNTS